MISRFIFWPGIAGAVCLLAGLFLLQRELREAGWLDKLIALGSVFVAAPLATFGAEHLAGAHSMVQIVPAWFPVHLFWVYFVGIALVAAALSLIARKYVQLSVPLLAVLFFVFVFTIHIPNVIAHAKLRLLWTVALRDLTFAAGSLALAGSQIANTRPRLSTALVCLGRWLVAIPLIVFGIEYFVHPEIAPGVPLVMTTPAWVPLPSAWTILTGVLLVICGLAILLNRYACQAAACVGLLMTVITVLVYTPVLAMAAPASQLEALNYVADTLLYGGVVLFLARALCPASSAPKAVA